MEFTDYPKPSLAVDPAVLAIVNGELHVALWQRTWEPFAGKWALPGVFLGPDESLEDAARRGILSKVGIAASHLEQLFTWNMPDRDERGWVVTVAYFAIVTESELAAVTEAHGRSTLFRLIPSEDQALPLSIKVLDQGGRQVELAFDHSDILVAVLQRLRDNIWRSDLALKFVGKQFTLRSLQAVYEAILGQALNKDSFRRRVVQTQQIVVPTGKQEENVSHRPAELYEPYNEV